MIEAFIIFIVVFLVLFPPTITIMAVVYTRSRNRAKKAASAMGWPSLNICRHALNLPNGMGKDGVGGWAEIIRANGPYKGVDGRPAA